MRPRFGLLARFATWFSLLVIASCAPKGVQSPVEKAPPPAVERARALTEDGDVTGARRAYERFIIEHPGTVEADLARLELGMLEAASEGCLRAMPHFEQASDSVDRAIALRAALRVAACQVDAKRADEALETLLPLAPERFSEKEQALLWSTAHTAAEQTLDAPLALALFDALLISGPSPDPERTAAVLNVLAMKLSVEQAAILFEELEPRQAPRLAVAVRLLEHGLQAQDAEWVRRTTEALRDSEATADEEIRMLVVRGEEFLHGNPYVVGALLPLSGRGREVGRQLLQGMQLAALHEGGPELVAEDTAGDPARAAAAMATLIGDRRVVAVLGPVGLHTTDAAAEEARRAGVPLLTFSAAEHLADLGGSVFRFLYSPRDELRALVHASQRRGAKRYTILYPDHGYGRTLARIFEEEVRAVGEDFCPGIAYPPGTRSFVEPVRALLAQGCHSVLLADVAEQVASIAPTFAAEGAWSTADDRLPEHAERRVGFLIPSPSWTPELLTRAARYLQGALAVVPYYDASEAPASQYFRAAYLERYGRAPEAFGAYGYDAYRLVSTTLRRGYQTREALGDALRAGDGVVAVTAIDRFSELGAPARPPPVYEVQGQVLVLAP